MINKRYKDIFDSFIYKNEKTPFSLGTLVVLFLCFTLLIIATFTQVQFYVPILSHSGDSFLEFKKVLYNPQIVTSIFIIYLLRRAYSYVLFFLYLFVGIFIWPIFVFGFGFDVFQNYLFGYYLGFFFAIMIAGLFLSTSNNIKARLLGGYIGIIVTHIVGIIYCFFLAIFKVIDFNLVIPIISVITKSKIFYDLFFITIIMLIAPYIKNIFWICMKPKMDKKKKKKIIIEKRIG